MHSVGDVLHDLAAPFAEAGVDWYLFGAQAALLRGSRRMTADVDFTVLPGETPTAAISRALERNGLSVRAPDVDDFVATSRVIPVIHRSTGMPVYVVLGGPGLEEEFLAGAEAVTLHDFEIRVPRAADLVLMKLTPGRGTDLDDAEAIARANALAER